MKFKADIRLGKNVVITEEFELDCIDETTLLYDNVQDKVFDIMDEKYDEETYPKAEIQMMFIYNEEDKEYYPIVGDDKKEIKDMTKSKKYKKFLILPYAIYSLTPESKLWMNLKEKGIIHESDEFNYDKYHELLEDMKK